MCLDSVPLIAVQFEFRAAMRENEIERCLGKLFSVSKRLPELLPDSTDCVAMTHTLCDLGENLLFVFAIAFVLRHFFLRTSDKEIELREDVVQLRL